MIYVLKSFWMGSIKRQLILAVALVHAVMMGFFTIDLVENERSFLIKQHKQSAISLASTLSTASTSWVLANDFVGLEEVVLSVRSYPSVNTVMIVDKSGYILAHSESLYVGKYLSDKKSLSFLKESKESIDPKTIFSNTQYVDVVAPILRDDQHIGWTRIVLDKKEINKAIDNVMLNGVFYMVIAIIIGTILAFFMSIGITRGIYKILETIKKVKDGDQNAQSKLNRVDEIGTLSLEFDNMLEQIAKQNSLINSVIDSSPDLIFYKEYDKLDGIYIGCNKAFSEFVGKPKSQIVGFGDEKIFTPEVARFFRKVDKEILLAKKTDINEEWVKYPDGSDVLLDTLKTPLYNADGSILGLLGMSRNITDKFKVQQEIEGKNKILYEQSKLASMGEMIGNIAHQWRQPLSVISTGATGLKVKKEFGKLDDEELIQTCDMINDSAQYLSKTIDDFRDFIKGDRKKVTFDLSDDIESFLHLVKGSITNHNIIIKKDFDTNIKLDGYPNELIQCYINIFNNAKDILKTINTQRYFFIKTVQKNDKVIISFKDNAGGIPKDIISHIFEPYFTTKHKSQGTGLGLSMSRKFIVEGMRGTIEARNVSYKFEEKSYIGAEFIITIPIKDDLTTS